MTNCLQQLEALVFLAGLIASGPENFLPPAGYYEVREGMSPKEVVELLGPVSHGSYAGGVQWNSATGWRVGTFETGRWETRYGTIIVTLYNDKVDGKSFRPSRDGIEEFYGHLRGVLTRLRISPKGVAVQDED